MNYLNYIFSFEKERKNKSFKRTINKKFEEEIMAFKDIRSFMNLLEKRGELVKVTAEVDAELEITEITDRISKQYGPALLFENVKDQTILF